MWFIQMVEMVISPNSDKTVLTGVNAYNESYLVGGLQLHVGLGKNIRIITA